MADKNNTSSLLEAIKNKLSKFDNKPKPESKKSPVNYFSQDLPDAEIDKSSIDKTNIGLIFEAEKKLENIRKKNLNQNINKQKDIDLDLDDESLNVKDLGQKISIESKIKEIADELNLEEFEDDFEDEGTHEVEEEIVEEVNKNLDPIDIELMELEKEIAKNNQQKNQNNSEDQIAEDLNIKTYLDSKFEDEFEKIEEEIKKEQNVAELDSSNVLKPFQNNENDNNLNKINFNQTQNQILFKITPAQDFLNKKAEEVIEEKAEEVSLIQASLDEKFEENIVENKNIVEEKLEEVIEEKAEEVSLIQASLDEKLEENIAENINIAEEKVEEVIKEKVEEVIEKVIEEKVQQALPIQASLDKKLEENIVENKNIVEQKLEEVIEEKIVENYFLKEQSQKIENKKQPPNFINVNDQEPIKSDAEIIEKNNLILEKINYNLIHEETIYQASNSMKKLMEAKNLVNNIGNFARDETLTKIAINLMEPKLEKWLNENLPLMVENIVREEIEKIVPKV